MPLPDVPRATYRDIVGGVIAVLVVLAISWSALWDGSQAAGTALVGALGAVTGWLFRSGQATPPNGNGYTNGSAGSGGGGTTSPTA